MCIRDSADAQQAACWSPVESQTTQTSSSCAARQTSPPKAPASQLRQTDQTQGHVVGHQTSRPDAQAPTIRVVAPRQARGHLAEKVHQFRCNPPRPRAERHQQAADDNAGTNIRVGCASDVHRVRHVQSSVELASGLRTQPPRVRHAKQQTTASSATVQWIAARPAAACAVVKEVQDGSGARPQTMSQTHGGGHVEAAPLAGCNEEVQRQSATSPAHSRTAFRTADKATVPGMTVAFPGDPSVEQLLQRCRSLLGGGSTSAPEASAETPAFAAPAVQPPAVAAPTEPLS